MSFLRGTRPPREVSLRGQVTRLLSRRAGVGARAVVTSTLSPHTTRGSAPEGKGMGPSRGILTVLAPYYRLPAAGSPCPGPTSPR